MRKAAVGLLAHCCFFLLCLSARTDDCIGGVQGIDGGFEPDCRAGSVLASGFCIIVSCFGNRHAAVVKMENGIQQAFFPAGIIGASVIRKAGSFFEKLEDAVGPVSGG